jgi:ketosteroid isomerase-like protein
MANQEEAIKQFYASYLDTFHTGEAKAMVPFYHAPCLFITDQGVMLLSNEAEIEKLFAQIIEGLKGRNYSHTEVTDVQIKELSVEMALFSGLAVRYTKTGEELERLSATYTMRKSNNAWQFITIVAHSPETLLRFA